MKMLGVKVIVIWSFSHLLAGVGLLGEGESKILLDIASSNDQPDRERSYEGPNSWILRLASH